MNKLIRIKKLPRMESAFRWIPSRRIFYLRIFKDISRIIYQRSTGMIVIYVKSLDDFLPVSFVGTDLDSIERIIGAVTPPSIPTTADKYMCHGFHVKH